jgi:hypothetical protein
MMREADRRVVYVAFLKLLVFIVVPGRSPIYGAMILLNITSADKAKLKG